MPLLKMSEGYRSTRRASSSALLRVLGDSILPGFPVIGLSTILQKMTVFLEDYDQNLYPDYWALLTTNFIAGNQP